MNELERVKSFFNTLPKRPEIIEFEQSTHTSELAALALGVEPGQIAKSLLFITNKGPLMVVTCGDKRINQKKIKENLGLKARFANPEQVLEYTGYTPGGVCPFALKTQFPIYLDKSMRNFDIVYAAAGTSNTAVPVRFEELMNITNGIECDFCE
ncbi:MAG: YbaK/EbsC family protein [Ignavibacteriales bacterium]